MAEVALGSRLLIGAFLCITAVCGVTPDCVELFDVLTVTVFNAVVVIVVETVPGEVVDDPEGPGTGVSARYAPAPTRTTITTTAIATWTVDTPLRVFISSDATKADDY